MKTYEVVFSRRAERHVDAVYRHILAASGRTRAVNAVGKLVHACRSPRNVPHRGTIRHDLGPGIRVIGHRKWATIVFTLDKGTVTILAIFARGRDLRTAFDEIDWANSMDL